MVAGCFIHSFDYVALCSWIFVVVVVVVDVADHLFSIANIRVLCVVCVYMCCVKYKQLRKQ